MAPDDEEETLRECPACGGDTRRDCLLCLGAGCVSAAKAATWLFERAGRIASGEHRIDLTKDPDDDDGA